VLASPLCTCAPSHLEYGYPGVADVVEVDGALVRVEVPGPTHVVVLVPVDAAVDAGRSERRGQRAGGAALRLGRHAVAAQHPVLTRRRADERAVFTFLRHVVRTDGHVVHTGGEEDMHSITVVYSTSYILLFWGYTEKTI